MKAQHRSKLQRLDTILADYARAERIALQRLAEAGFKFTSVSAAVDQQTILRRHMEQQRESLLLIESMLS